MASSSRELLDAAYSRLGFAEGDLLSAAATPGDSSSQDWVNKGDWLALANKVGAEKLFFVENNPVIVFAEQHTQDPAEWLRWFNSVWCMARPQLLFLARQGELCVFNLTRQPARRGEDPDQNRRLLDTVRAAAEVQDRLYRYSRDQVESGRLFREDYFGSDDRADRALIRDLGAVREALIKADLAAPYAHSLIGRSIFIRYLEDREVLVEKYFRKVAKGNQAWAAILDHAQDATAAPPSGKDILYARVLTNKAFTYALFAQLSKDFNGDMFPVNPDEHRIVAERHLRLLRNFLLGGQDESLFFFAYRFDIIPIELISSIYEKFYSINPKKKRDEGSYYTPSALVEFVLSQTLTSELLGENPRVLDPACGSGIFLVETYRRIVRHQVALKKRRLTAEELRAILRDQIRGIDINPEAIRVAAFSLYLAMLHYLEPPDILQNKLPSLTYGGAASSKHPDKFFNVLLAEDAFRINETVSDETVLRRFRSGCADIVVGNPPWGAPKAEEEERLSSDGGVAWCKARGLSVGYKERSETFTHRTIDFLRAGGRAGLLLSTGVFFKRHGNTRKFREQWLTQADLCRVVNFAAVRNAFFKGSSEDGKSGEGDESLGEGSIAPFAAVIFDKVTPREDSVFLYWSAKETAFVRRVQAVVLNHADLRMARQKEFLENDDLWKIYWWGGHRDEALIKRLGMEITLGRMLDPNGELLGTGFQEAKEGRKDCEWLQKYKEFPTKFFKRYGPLPKKKFRKPPEKVIFPREEYLYKGPRLLIKEGPSSDDVQKGRIVARFQTEKFCFRYSINCLPTGDLNEADAKVLLGIIWSSLVRYFLFMTSGTWGLWHDAIRQEVIRSIPVRLPKNQDLTARIVTAVDALRSIPDADTEEGSLFAKEGMTRERRNALIAQHEGDLDVAVYQLFELTEDEKGRIEEMCSIGFDLFYHGMDSVAVEPLDWPDLLPKFGRRQDLGNNGIASRNEICRYFSTFLDLWEPQLQQQGGRFRWRIIRPSGTSTVLAAIFQGEDPKEPLPDPQETDEQAWGKVLEKIDQVSRMPARARRVYIDGLIRVVTDDDIVIVKRNERRLWTQSAARDDAEATMVRAMNLGTGDGKAGTPND